MRKTPILKASLSSPLGPVPIGYIYIVDHLWKIVYLVARDLYHTRYTYLLNARAREYHTKQQLSTQKQQTCPSSQKQKTTHHNISKPKTQTKPT
nr:MAG TPA: hypothetical protein [Caudoviricetes sp.]